MNDVECKKRNDGLAVDEISSFPEFLAINTRELCDVQSLYIIPNILGHFLRTGR